jgi:RNAse (barnase) inhibitor barstar
MSTPALDTLLAECRKPEGKVVVQAASLSAEEAGRLAASLNARDIQARVIDGARLTGKAELLRALAEAFSFPSHFGHNWDALVDCLSDMSWLPAAGYVCLFLNADAFRTADPRAHETFLEIGEDVAERWREYDPTVVFKLLRAAKS